MFVAQSLLLEKAGAQSPVLVQIGIVAKVFRIDPETVSIEQGCPETIPAFHELRCKTVPRTHDRRVRQRQSPLDQIAQIELVAEVPARVQNNDLSIKMPSIEQPLRTFPLAHYRLPVRRVCYFNRSRQPICTRAF